MLQRPVKRALLTAILGGTIWSLAQSQDQSVPSSAVSPAPLLLPSTNATPPSPPLPRTAHEEAGRCVEGSEQACMDLVRTDKEGKEHRIMVIRTGTDDTTGIYTVCSPPSDAPAGSPNIGVFSESGASGIRIVIDKNLIQVPLAIVTQSPPKEGQSGSDGKVEASNGTAKALDDVPEGKTDRLSLCGVTTEQKPTPNTVLITQGRTQLIGQQLSYDGAEGIARIAGPISFNRADQAEPLSGESSSIEIDVDTEATVLVGNVVLRSKGGRVSKAARVEYDDASNTARLYATADQPAESTKGSDVLRISKGVIVYNLDKNEVYANAEQGGSISGEFQDASNP